VADYSTAASNVLVNARASAARFAFLACLSMQQAQDHWSQQRFLQPVDRVTRCDDA
jgi:hypothetical protein